MLKKSKIGLFGTCGRSEWRKPFVHYLTENNIPFYNPQLGEGEWNPDFANEYVQKEHFHLKNDDIIVFAVTDETTASVSLSELGFSVNDVLRTSKNRYCIFYISEDCNAIGANDNEIIGSNKARKTIIPKIKALAQETNSVFIVNSLDELLELTIDLEKIVSYSEELHLKYSNFS